MTEQHHQQQQRGQCQKNAHARFSRKAAQEQRAAVPPPAAACVSLLQ
jgi:hypothetical protein